MKIQSELYSNIQRLYSGIRLTTLSEQNDITSAGSKGSYAYDRLIELFAQSVVAPESTFIFGCDYRIPAMHGLLNKRFIQELKLSNSFKTDSFAREYLSINPPTQWTLNLPNCEKNPCGQLAAFIKRVQRLSHSGVGYKPMITEAVRYTICIYDIV